MLTIQSDRLIIELEHPEPKELLKDLQNSLIVTLRLLCSDAASEIPTLTGRELCDASLPIIDLFQVIISHQKH